MKNKLLILMFVTAFVTMCYEILGTSILFFFYEKSSKSVAIVLGVFMFGLTMGSYLSSKWKVNVIYTNMLAGLWGLFIFPMYDKLYLITQIIPSKIIVSILYFLPLTVLLGFNYPLLNKLYGDNMNKVYTVDLIGATIGVVFAGFLFVPVIGIKLSLIIISLILIATNIYLLFTTNLSSLSLTKKSIYSGIILILISIPLMSAFIVNDIENKEIILQSEYGEVIVKMHSDNKYGISLYINKGLQCTTFFSFSEKLMSVKTLEQFDKPVDVLNIGLGCGFTAQFVLKNEKVKSLDIVEINQKVVDVQKYFKEYNDDVLSNHKTNLIINDGFIHLRESGKKYDAILIDVQGPRIVQSSSLFTVEAFKFAQERLNEDGILSIWIDSNIGEIPSIYNTLDFVFENVVFVEVDKGSVFYASNRELSIEPTQTNFEQTKIRSINNI